MTRAQTTLSRFIMEQTKDRDMTILMNALQLSCKYITRAVRKAGIAGLYGMAGEVNSTGDDVKKLDILSNEIMVRNCSRASPRVARAADVLRARPRPAPPHHLERARR